MARRLRYLLAIVALLAVVAYLAFATGAIAPYLAGYDPADPEGYDHTPVTVVDAETGAERGSVEAAVADTFPKRYVGLSETDRLPPDRGMLFVHDEAGRYTYVMRNMSFAIDIVFVAENGTITTIHHAPAPGSGEDGSDREYEGQGRYVLEVNYNWTTDHDVEVGDRVAFDL